MTGVLWKRGKLNTEIHIERKRTMGRDIRRRRPSSKRKKKKNWCLEQSIQKQPPEGSKSVNIFISDFWLPKPWDNIFLLFKTASWWYAVMASLAPVNPKGNKLWIFTGRADVEAEAPTLWTPDVKSWFIGEDSDAGKDLKAKGKEGNKGWVA